MNDEFPGIERDTATRRALGTAETILSRANIHRQYSFPPLDFPAWALARKRWRGDERVLDVGCGAGAYLRALRECAPGGALVAGDHSLCLLGDMAARSEGHGAALPSLLVMDELALPFPDRTFDVALAAHTLGYAPDIHQALDEIHRVLRPEGVLLAVTHSRGHMAEFDVLFRQAYALLGVADPGGLDGRPDQAFRLENGAALLSRHFAAVARYDIPSMLVFPDAAPVIDYLQCLRPVYAASLPGWVTWDLLMQAMEIVLRQVISYLGALVVNKRSGVFVATDAGDFAAPLMTIGGKALSAAPRV